MTLTRKGWNSLKPITAPEQMSTPIHWNPMSDDWKRWIDSHQVYNGESRFSKEMLDATVSYTHLTLPTKRIV